MKKRRREYESAADKEEGKTLFQEKTNLLDCDHKVKIQKSFDEEFHFNIGFLRGYYLFSFEYSACQKNTFQIKLTDLVLPICYMT
jgi:hypothetical protein